MALIEVKNAIKTYQIFNSPRPLREREKLLNEFMSLAIWERGTHGTN